MIKHSSGYLEVERIKDAIRWEGEQTSLISVFILLSVLAGVSAFLYGVKSTRGTETPLCRQTDAFFSLHFPLCSILLFLCFFSPIISLELA